MDRLKNLITFDKKRALFAVCLAVLVAFFCLKITALHLGMVFALVLAFAGSLKVNTKVPVWDWILNILWTIAITYITLDISITVVNVKNIMGYGYTSANLNIACMFLVYALMFFITARWKPAVSIGALILVLIVSINGFVYQFRGKELSPNDILSFGTALNVAKQYKFEIDLGVTQRWITWIFVFLSQFALPHLPLKAGLKTRVAGFVLTALLFTFVWRGTTRLPIKLWDNEGTQQGFYVNFFIGVRNSFVKKPEGYDPQEIEKKAKEYVSDEKSDEAKKPNIIVIMDESFVDFRVLGDDIKTNTEITPFIDSLKENTIKGYALSSVYGGNTANSEMEFLTGVNMAFLPSGSVPYQQYVKGELYSLPHYLNSIGYNSVATHPFPSDGWSRNKVYPYLGFKESTFINSYPREDILRYYVSDMEMFKYILDKIETEKWESPYFVFGITMQNHGGYTYKGKKFENKIKLEGYKGDYPLAEQYLSLLKYSDEALEYLIKELEKIDEDTIVLYFGDHYPRIEDKFYEEVHGEPLDELNEQILKHIVPFYIWANFDIEEKEVEITSLNYLSALLLDAAGMEKDPYNSFLFEAYDKIPAINPFVYFSKKEKDLIPLGNAKGEEKEWLNLYAQMQYNNLLDSKNRSDTFFDNYISYNKSK